MHCLVFGLLFDLKIFYSVYVVSQIYLCVLTHCRSATEASDTALSTDLQTPKEGGIKLPKWTLRTVACLVLSGQVFLRILQGKVHWRNTLEQLSLVGPRSLGVALLTAAFVGMVFTIQVLLSPTEFTRSKTESVWMDRITVYSLSCHAVDVPDTNRCDASPQLLFQLG